MDLILTSDPTEVKNPYGIQGVYMYFKFESPSLKQAVHVKLQAVCGGVRLKKDKAKQNLYKYFLCSLTKTKEQTKKHNSLWNKWQAMHMPTEKQLSHSKISGSIKVEEQGVYSTLLCPVYHWWKSNGK